MAIEGSGQPHVQPQIGDAPPIAADAKPEGAAAAPSHVQKEVANLGPSTLSHIPEAAENRKETGPQNGATPVSAGKANEVAQSIFIRRPPPGPSPRSKQAVVHSSPQAMELIGGGSAPILEAIQAKEPKQAAAPRGVPDFRPGRPKVSPEERAAFRQRLAEREPPSKPGELPNSSRLRSEQPANLTRAFTDYQTKKTEDMAALRAARARDPILHRAKHASSS